MVRAAISPDSPDYGDKVQTVAARAATSPRTVYRVLGREMETLKLGLADRLVMACGRHLTEIGARVKLADGREVDYLDA